MTRRYSLVLLMAMTTGTLAFVPTDLHAQTTAADTSPPSRTEWGDPDLQGVWDFRTLTPMERPDELADKQVLTAEEAAQFRKGRLAEIAALDDEVPADIVATTTNSGSIGERLSSGPSARRWSWTRQMAEFRP